MDVTLPAYVPICLPVSERYTHYFLVPSFPRCSLNLSSHRQVKVLIIFFWKQLVLKTIKLMEREKTQSLVIFSGEEEQLCVGNCKKDKKSYYSNIFNSRFICSSFQIWCMIFHRSAWRYAKSLHIRNTKVALHFRYCQNLNSIQYNQGSIMLLHFGFFLVAIIQIKRMGWSFVAMISDICMPFPVGHSQNRFKERNKNYQLKWVGLSMSPMFQSHSILT